MGRKHKDTVEYFPFVVKDGKTLFVLQRKYGLAGIGFFTQVLRMLGQTPGHYYTYVDEYDKDRFNVYCGLSESDVRAMLADMAKTGKIDRELWERRSVIYSQAFVDELADLYRKRATDAPDVEFVKKETEELEGVINPPEKRGNPEICGYPPESADFRQHSIGEDSIGEESISSAPSAEADASHDGGDLSPLKDELADQYQQAFASQTPSTAWKSIAQERKHLNDIAKRTRRLSAATGRSEQDLAGDIMTTYAEARRTGKGEYWRNAPWTPSALTARWDQIIERMRQSAEVEEALVF